MVVCKRCGSTDRQPNGKGCVDCHRASLRRRYRTDLLPGLNASESQVFRRLLRDDFEDVVVTPAARAYLRAFDAFLLGGVGGDSRAVRHAMRARERLLRALEDL